MYNWNNVQDVSSQSYICSYCNLSLASAKGWMGVERSTGRQFSYLLLCHRCTRPTFLDHNGRQYPGAVFGNEVNDIPDKTVVQIYQEARLATGAGAYTAAVLCCRKLLMHIAVAKGAKPGEPFAAYVDFLEANHHISPDAKEWVDHIRTKGNEANHEIVLATQTDARDLVSFCEMLLKTMFEFPAMIKKKRATQPNS